MRLTQQQLRNLKCSAYDLIHQEERVPARTDADPTYDCTVVAEMLTKAEMIRLLRFFDADLRYQYFVTEWEPYQTDDGILLPNTLEQTSADTWLEEQS